MIRGGAAITERGIVDDAVIVVEKGRIADIGSGKSSSFSPSAHIVDATGCWLVPGFIDLHLHGGNGSNLATNDASEVLKITRFLASCGTTSFLATLSTGPVERIIESISVVRELIGSQYDGAEIVGIHLEGPYISRERKGAMNPKYIRRPSIDETDRAIDLAAGSIRMVTLAPELEGSLELIRHLADQGIVVSIGHSNATYDEAMVGIDAGITHATHTYNAMSGLHHRESGVVGAVLTSESVTCQLIADLVHVSPAAAQVLIRCKGPSKVAVITDNGFAAGLPDGIYSQTDGRSIFKDNGSCTLENGTLAGSVSLMNQNVRNMVSVLGISLPEAIEMASLTPARVARVDQRKGSLRVGKDADIVIMDDEFEVNQTYVKGRLVYSRGY